MKKEKIKYDLLTIGLIVIMIGLIGLSVYYLFNGYIDAAGNHIAFGILAWIALVTHQTRLTIEKIESKLQNHGIR